MGTDRQLCPPHRCAPRSRLITGRIVPVQGGHVVRSTGRKDRHSKVCTAKGPRDRRVRLSAHTAIQFYDVQDRLGYDRPSKAVDWLIQNAKAAIDELAELPPWKPTATAAATASSGQGDEEVRDPPRATAAPPDYAAASCSGFLPPSLDGDAIADTIKSFFPMAETETAGSASSSSYQHSQVEDLRLSLQSFHAPVLLLHDQPQPPIEQSILSTSVPTQMAYDPPPPPPGSWPYEDGGAGGFDFTRPLDPTIREGSSLVHQQRESLQSSSLPTSMRGWSDPLRQAWSSAAIGFEPGGGGFSRFVVPERFHGVDDSDGSSNYHPNNPSSVPPF